MIFADDPDMSVSELDGQLASLKVIEYAMRLAAEHHRAPRKITCGALLDGRIDGRPLSEEEFGWMFVLMLVGGNESPAP
jgi:cholest-4-en-3-one 26-monooxygenase